MNRNQLKILEKWLSKSSRKPLIIRGARQVGKSTLVELFAKKNQLSLAEINLERHLELASVFEEKNTRKILNVLEAIPDGVTIDNKTILFLDEIQAVPDAIPALRYFYEDMNDLAVIAAGSLLEFSLSDHKYSMPVGRIEYLHMGPMTFTEFLEGIGELKLASFIRSFEFKSKIDPLIHNRLTGLLKIYFYVGGMPEAVKAYAENRQIKEATEVHSSLIETYREDFPKYIGSRSLARVQKVFNYSARNIGKKVKYSLYSKEDKSTTIKNDIELLCMARILSKVIHSNSNGLPLQAELKESNYKMIFLDVGLMNSICGIGWQSIADIQDTELVNKGGIAEQFIGQHLLDLLAPTTNRQLTYWVREGKNSNAEVDYTIALNGKIIPIEVKAGASGSLKSLHQFVGEKKVPYAVRFDANTPSTQLIATTYFKGSEKRKVDYNLYSLPLYLIERLEDFVTTDFV